MSGSIVLFEVLGDRKPQSFVTLSAGGEEGINEGDCGGSCCCEDAGVGRPGNIMGGGNEGKEVITACIFCAKVADPFVSLPPSVSIISLDDLVEEGNEGKAVIAACIFCTKVADPFVSLSPSVSVISLGDIMDEGNEGKAVIIACIFCANVADPIVSLSPSVSIVSLPGSTEGVLADLGFSEGPSSGLLLSSSDPGKGRGWALLPFLDLRNLSNIFSVGKRSLAETEVLVPRSPSAKVIACDLLSNG